MFFILKADLFAIKYAIIFISTDPKKSCFYYELIYLDIPKAFFISNNYSAYTR